VLVDLFIQSFDQPPRHLTLDIDAFDDPAHGQQQLIMFHGYYDQYRKEKDMHCAAQDLKETKKRTCIVPLHRFRPPGQA
jgi:hypothetical protein